MFAHCPVCSKYSQGRAVSAFYPRFSHVREEVYSDAGGGERSELAHSSPADAHVISSSGGGEMQILLPGYTEEAKVHDSLLYESNPAVQHDSHLNF